MKLLIFNCLWWKERYMSLETTLFSVLGIHSRAQLAFNQRVNMASLRQEISQRQHLAPQLQQSTAILQMTALDLNDMVQSELNENPFLEGTAVTAPPEPLPASKGPAAPSDAVDFIGNLKQDIPLNARLLAQLSHLDLTVNDRKTAVFMIGMLDDAGYLRETDTALAQMLDICAQDVAVVRGKLQGLDPSGLFCTDLIEYLRFQLRDMGPLETTYSSLLDYLSENGFAPAPQLATALSISTAMVETHLSVIRTLKSHPLAGADHPALPPLQPDIIISGSVSQGWNIELNEALVPQVFLNSSYYAVIKDQIHTDQDRVFAAEMFKRAHWLLRCIAQRSHTLLRVADVIVHHQERFLDGNANEVNPLTLSDIATRLDLHPSTISRATSNKFLSAPSGTIPLKTLLTRAVGNAGKGPGFSSHHIKSLIQKTINSEDASTPFSDEKICGFLFTENIKVARRTVAKYRGQMNIPNTSSRRKQAAEAKLRGNVAHNP